MSSTLPIAPDQTSSAKSDFADVVEGAGESFDLVSILLAEQQSLTAVEEFSKAHDQAEGDTSSPEQAKYYSRLMPASPPGPGQQFAFEVNLDTCSGCKACVVACHTMNGLEEEESWRKVGTLVLGDPESTIAADVDPKPPVESSPQALPQAVGVQHVTTACHHCEAPGCLLGCPVKAYDKDPVTGIVRHLDDQCIGCKYCTMMCPYEVPKYSKRLGIVRKCDMCHQRLKTGEAPACVQSCPNEAISIRIVERDLPRVDKESRLVPGAPLSVITRPTTQYVSADASKTSTSMPQDEGVDPVAESHWPLAVMLVMTQVSVGMLLLERVIASFGWLIGSPLDVNTTKWVATLSLVVGMVGMNLAPLHLGQPLRAWRVFLGLRTSWLSREAVILGQFVGLLVAAVGLFWLPTFLSILPTSLAELIPEWFVIPDWAAKAALGSAILVGVAGLYSSAMIYIATARWLWRPSRTFKRFFGSGVVAGAAMTAVVFGLTTDGMSGPMILSLIASVGTVIKLVWEQRHHLSASAKMDDAWDERSRRLVVKHLNSLRLGRLAMGWLGALAAFGCVGFAMAGMGPAVALTAFSAAALILGGELMERLLYFSSVVHDRMPGTIR